MANDVESVRIILERILLMSISEGDAKLVLDDVGKLLTPQRSPTTRAPEPHLQNEALPCPNCGYLNRGSICTHCGTSYPPRSKRKAVR